MGPEKGVSGIPAADFGYQVRATGPRERRIGIRRCPTASMHAMNSDTGDDRNAQRPSGMLLAHFHARSGHTGQSRSEARGGVRGVSARGLLSTMVAKAGIVGTISGSRPRAEPPHHGVMWGRENETKRDETERRKKKIGDEPGVQEVYRQIEGRTGNSELKTQRDAQRGSDEGRRGRVGGRRLGANNNWARSERRRKMVRWSDLGWGQGGIIQCGEVESRVNAGPGREGIVGNDEPERTSKRQRQIEA
ncbi:hypothetical protein V8D89_007421 [Ganoderma adspersum]